MDEYIEREAAIRVVNGQSSLTMTRISLIDSISNIPAADVAPVVHGRWIGAPLCGNDNCKCSECGSWHNIHANLRGEIMQKYCPNCGAKMDGGDGDEAD